jgi:fumarate reductase (CoM/CoB) subunit A
MIAVKDTYRPDILIVGGGGAAAMAALEAHRHGVKPLIVCKDTFLGGATVQASGGTAVPFLPEDSPDRFVADTLMSGAFINNKTLVKILAEEAKETIYGFEQEGFLLDRSFPSQIRGVKRSEGHSILRSYSDRRQAHGIVNFLHRRVLEEKIPLLEERMLLRLFTEEGEVRGGLFFSLEDGELEFICSRVVILATGGCGHLYSVTTNANCLTGEGYAIAFQAGAELVDMEMVQFLPLAFPFPPTLRGTIIGMCSLFGTKVKLYNGLGERYMERYAPKELEFATRDVVARANYLEIQEGRGTKRRTIVVDPRENDRAFLKVYRETSTVIYDMIAEAFGEKAASWQVPFEAIPAQHFMMGGVKIDEYCSSSVKNLFCCGEVSGGIHGANRLSGNALTEIYVFGKRAGRVAADRVPKASSDSPYPEGIKGEVDRITALLNCSEGVSPFRLKQDLQKVMWDCVGIVRDREGLKRALKNIQNLKHRFRRISPRCREKRWNRQWLEVLEIGLMLDTAELIATSASQRQESRGSHYRRDFPKSDPDWVKNVVLCKGQDGGIRAIITPVS